jgi:pimeloyl-ACP methyl ester carboxylesterase
VEITMKKITKILALATALTASAGMAAQPSAAQPKPTIVLVHGAFAESSSWDGVIAELSRDGYTAVAAANPLRSVASDAAAVSAVVRSIPGPVVLVGHSYGGPVVTEAANDSPNVKALVYVAAFAPDRGESSLSLSGKFPGGTLGGAIVPVERPNGVRDLFIERDKFHAQFAADVPEDQADLMAATQRPVTEAALAEPSGNPAWRKLPSYSIYGSEDRNIPPAVMRFMAERAHSVKTVVIDGASHALMVSHPREVAAVIEAAATKQ